MNAYTHNGTLVSILKDAEVATVISSKGTVMTVKRSELIPTQLLSSGLYNRDFFQAALGGLVEPPAYVHANLQVFKGKFVTAFAEPIDQNIVKYAIGISNDSLTDDAAHKRNRMRVNDGKQVDWEKEKGHKLMDEISDLDSMGNEGTPEELQIEDADSIATIKRLVIEWKDTPIEGISIADIKNLFGEGKPLPDPDVIKINTGKEQIVRKKSDYTPRWKWQREAYYGPTPVMIRTCPECGTMLVYNYDKKSGVATQYCPIDKKHYDKLYEGSLPGEGVSGQSKTE